MDAQTQTHSSSDGSVPLRRVGIIGDVHAQNGAVKAALVFLHALPDLSAILCSGDLVTGDGDAGEAVTLLQNARTSVVRGNHDRWFGKDYYLSLPRATDFDALSAKNKSYLFSLPPTRTFRTVSGDLMLCHGVDDDDMAGIYPGGPRSAGTDGGNNDELAWMLQKKDLAGYRYLVAGHTHLRMVQAVVHTGVGVTTVINAGTLLPDQKPGFLIADFAAQTATVYHLSPDFTITEGQTVSLRPDTQGQ